MDKLKNKNLFVRLYLPFVALFVVGELFLIGFGATESSAKDPVVQWQWLLLFFLFFGATTTFTNDPREFYGGGEEFSATGEGAFQTRKRATMLALALSTFISWVFAKSVYNASTLGARFGWVGGLAYAAYYISFASAAIVIGVFRNQGFASLPLALHTKYGSFACFGFLLAVAYRLFNEIWSNSIIVGDFYGPRQSGQWWAAVVVSTLIPMGYVICGGMRMSIFSDVFQAMLALLFIFILLGVMATKVSATTLFNYNPVPSRNMWSLEGGFDLLIVALLQGMFSYPFFDPVLTDRTFLCTVPVMQKAFFIGGTVAAIYIFAFSFLGIYGASIGVGGTPQKVSLAISPAMFLIVSLIMITSSMSTVDSTFTSTAKCLGLESTGLITRGIPKSNDKAKGNDVLYGRIAIVIMAIVGTLPLLGDAVVLDATTISGTVVMGLGPPIILGMFVGPGTKRLNYRLPLAFNLSFWCGVILGILLQAGVKPPTWFIGKGSYALLLGYNIYGSLLCLGFYLIGLALHAFVLPKDYVELAPFLGKQYFNDSDSLPSSSPAVVEEAGAAPIQKEPSPAEDAERQSPSVHDSEQYGSRTVVAI